MKSQCKNWNDQNFLSVEAINRVVDSEEVLTWARGQFHKPDLIDRIRNDFALVFAGLLLAGLAHLTLVLMDHGLDNTKLFDNGSFERCCDSAGLKSSEKQDLAENRQHIGIVLEKNKHICLPKDVKLPYRKRVYADEHGAFGLIFKNEVVPGHLREVKMTTVCEKYIRPSSSPKQSEHHRILREVETLQGRRHSSLISLLASYELTSVESDCEVKSYHLIFPWADTNLWNWMTSSDIPLALREKSHPERRVYLCNAMCALESGLSYLHQELEGQITGHYDLKPENILVINNELKIADFGRSHLRPATSRSETEGDEGLGTYTYQPPEYWGDEDRDKKFKHGRAFDVWSMGCIMIELATLAVDDWENAMVLEFKEKRLKNKIREKSKLAEIKVEDRSFHNNLSVVREWIASLERHDRSFGPLREILKVTSKMIAEAPQSRLYSWEAEMDLYEVLSFDDRSRLLELGALLSVRNPPHEIRNGFQTPLHRAVVEGKCERLCKLLDLGWPMFVQDEYGMTPFHLIEHRGNVPMREILYGRLGYQSNRPVPSGNDSLELLLQRAKQDDIEGIDDQLKKGVNPLWINSQGHCASYISAKYGHKRVLERLLRQNRREQLVQKDFAWRETPLLKAASSGHADIVDYLLSPSQDEYRPDIEDHQKEGKTALFLAAEWDRTEVIRVLLRHGAQVFTKRVSDWKGQYGHEGETSIHAAARYGYHEALKLLLEAADADRCLKHQDARGRTPELLALSGDQQECLEVLRQRKK